MGSTALQERGEGLGATASGEYRGLITAARFTDPQAEFAALRSGCAIFDSGFRTKISLTGGDRGRWLNGMVTNNIRDLAAGEGVYAFLLNPQGHILADLCAFNRGESIVVETDQSQLEIVLATFDHYIIMDDVEVTNLSEQATALGIGGPKSREVLAECGIQISDMRPLQIREMKSASDTACTVVRTDDPAIESYELWLDPAEVRKMWDALTTHGATPIGSEALELHRIAAGIPLNGVDIRERDLPQETEQARALNFNKGCYVGQEIVERIRSRGAVHRKFSGFMIAGDATITTGAKIVAGEKEVGEITSVATLHSSESAKTIALGYIRREVGAPGRAVTIGSFPATVVAVPIGNSALSPEERTFKERLA